MKRALTISFFILLGAFTAYEARFLILGPRLSLETPLNGSTVEAGALTLAGRAKNVSSLSLNDKQIYTDTRGYFEERLIAHSGINIIKLEAKDRFGRTTTELVRILAN